MRVSSSARTPRGRQEASGEGRGCCPPAASGACASKREKRSGFRCCNAREGCARCHHERSRGRTTLSDFLARLDLLAGAALLFERVAVGHGHESALHVAASGRGLPRLLAPSPRNRPILSARCSRRGVAAAAAPRLPQPEERCGVHPARAGRVGAVTLAPLDECGSVGERPDRQRLWEGLQEVAEAGQDTAGVVEDEQAVEGAVVAS